MQIHSINNLLKKSFSLNELLQPLLTFFSYQAQQKGLMFMSYTHPDVPDCLHQDAEKIQQILNNLLSNAVRFTESGIIKLHILLKAHQHRTPSLCFRVVDSGTGISRSALPHIFEPYQQAGNAQQRLNGTGLGLSISRRLARAMSGDITVTSMEGRGSTFVFTLPLRLSAASLHSTALPIQNRQIHGLPPCHGTRIS